MNKFILILFSFIIIFSYSHAGIKEQKYNYTSLCIDDENILWIGTETGLYQWKNQSSVFISNTANLHITAIGAVNNHLVFGTIDGGIYVYSKTQHTLNFHGNLSSEISSIFYDGKAEIGISTKGNGFFLLSFHGLTHLTTKAGLPDNFIYQLFKNNNNQWCSSSDKGISLYNDSSQHFFGIFQERIPDRLVTCFAMHNNLIICGTQSGDVCRLNVIDSTIYMYDRNIWKGAQINSIILLDHSLCVATDQGAFMLDNEGHLIQNFMDGKPIKFLKNDLEGNVWLCGKNLLASYPAEQLRIISKINNQPITHVHSVLCDRNKQLWFTPDQGLIKYNAVNGSSQSIFLTKPRDLIDITSLFIDTKGKLWVATFGKGLFLVDTQTLQFKKVPIDTTEETSSILSITASKFNLWVSGLNGVWRTELNKQFYSFSSLEDQFKKKKFYVYQVSVDHKNAVWLATDGQGIQTLTENGLETFSIGKNINEKVFYSAAEDAANQMWFVPYENGIYCKINDTVIHLSSLNGLSSNDVSSIKKYGQHHMLAATSKGLDLINIHTFLITHYAFTDIHQGIIPEINSMCGDENGTVYIGTNKGLILFYLPSYRTEFKPKAVIENILVLERSVHKASSTFRHDENFFRFRIHAIWNSSATIYYRYKLEGLHNQWNQTVDKEIVFPRLNPGNYHFVLQVSTNKNFINPSESTYQFSINSPFYKQFWFLLLLGMSTLFGIYQLIRFREKRISRIQQLEKEKVIAEYETLKNQVNPHFLFNSLNTLMQVIDEDKELAIEYTQTMSEFYRSVLTYRSVNLISLMEELNLLKQYFYLQKMRYGNHLIFEDHCDEYLTETLAIPPLTLQLLAENAIKHNTISKSKTLTLTISISKNHIMVSNNINKKHQVEVGENIGLQNIINRYRLFTHHRVEILHNEITFEVKLPILKN